MASSGSGRPPPRHNSSGGNPPRTPTHPLGGESSTRPTQPSPATPQGQVGLVPGHRRPTGPGTGPSTGTGFSTGPPGFTGGASAASGTSLVTPGSAAFSDHPGIASGDRYPTATGDTPIMAGSPSPQQQQQQPATPHRTL